MTVQADPCPSHQQILVVDDERHIARLIQLNLLRQGHHVVCAYGEEEAISHLQRETFDVAVVDGDMPDVVTKARSRGLRVVVLRKKDGGDDPSGSDLYLTKPFNPMDILVNR